MTTPSKLEPVLDVPGHFEAVLPCPLLRVGELLEIAEGGLVTTARQAGETVEVFSGGGLVCFPQLAEASSRRAVFTRRFRAGNR